MKPDIHPNYRPVVFMDTSADFKFLTRSSVQSSETIEWEDGNTYPLYKVEISSESHPFFTGQMKIIDTAGRVERFERRYGSRRKSGEASADVAEASPEAVEPAAEAPEVVEPAAEAADTSNETSTEAES